MSAPVLEVLGLSVEFATDRGPLRAVDGVSFRVEAGQTLAIVGESGCGKSVTALAIMGLLPRGVRLGGAIRLLGQELIGHAGNPWQGRRGRDLAMVFQEPMTSLNPAFTAGEQVAEALRLHERLSPRAAIACRTPSPRTSLWRTTRKPPITRSLARASAWAYQRSRPSL